MLWRASKYLRRSPVNVLDLVVWPIVLVVPFGLFAKYTTNDLTILTILIVGAIGWVTTSSVQREVSLNFMIEVWQRTIKKSRVLPMSDFSFVTSTWVVGMIRGLMTFGLISTVAYFLFNVNVLAGDPAVLVLAMIGIFLSGLTIGMFIISVVKLLGHRANGIAWFITDILVVFSGIYYSVEILPTAIQKISYSIPLTYIFEALRQSLIHGQTLTTIMPMFVKMFVLLAVFLTAITAFFIYAEKRAIETGFYQKYD